MELELVVEPDIYSPSIDDKGNYVDRIPSFNIIKKGLYCPCGARKDKIYETHSVFSSHIKTKAHQSWLVTLNFNKTNFFIENDILKKTVQNQKLIIAKLEKDINTKILTIDYLTQQISQQNQETAILNHHKTVTNLLEFD
jgi:inner membrane protein involved in colicin E2 resistance